MKRRFRMLVGDLLEGLDQHLRTGRLVGKGGALVAEAEYRTGAT